MDRVDFTIHGRIPSKKNSKRILTGRNGKRFVASSEDFKAWEAEHVPLMRRFAGYFAGRRVQVDIEYRSETNRRWDLTNKTESIMDAMVEAGVIDDDCVQVVPNVHPRWLGKTGKDEAFVVIRALQEGKSFAA